MGMSKLVRRSLHDKTGRGEARLIVFYLIQTLLWMEEEALSIMPMPAMIPGRFIMYIPYPRTTESVT